MDVELNVIDAGSAVIHCNGRLNMVAAPALKVGIEKLVSEGPGAAGGRSRRHQLHRLLRARFPHRRAEEGVAVPDSLDLLHHLVERVGSNQPDVLSEDLPMLETAVIEIAGNLIEHGRPAGGVDYRLSLEVLLDRLEGMLFDGGEALPTPPLDGDKPDPFSEAGRGILIAQAVLDELTYERTAVANTWRVVRRRR